jgi:hypothetical protein
MKSNCVIYPSFTYLTELEQRKAAILEAIASQGKLTDELKAKSNPAYKKRTRRPLPSLQDQSDAQEQPLPGKKA